MASFLANARLAKVVSQFVLAMVALGLAGATARAFTLEIPQRQTQFPLVRPDRVGEVVAWGSNTVGQVTVPPGLTNIVAIAAGNLHNLALRNDGTVVAWGDNGMGQCNVPAGLADVVAIACGRSHSLALKSNGRVVAWGPIDGRIAVPSSLTNAVAISAWDNSFALRIDGKPVAWGSSSSIAPPLAATNIVMIRGARGLRADGIAFTLDDGPNSSPVPVSDIARVLGSSTSLAVRSDGVLILSYPIYPPGFKYVDAASTVYASAGVTADSTVLTWPSSVYYDPRFNAIDPTLGRYLNLLTNPPPRLRGVISICGGDYHFLALKLPTPPEPTTATASAQIINGFIVALNVIDGGEGYSTPPAVTISGGGGSGATATAIISRGVVTGFNMISAGAGYSGTPKITIDAPPVAPTIGIATSRVMVTMGVVAGKRYQLESSDDLPNFTPVGAPFLAETNSVQQEFVVSQTGQFFRLEEVP